MKKQNGTELSDDQVTDIVKKKKNRGSDWMKELSSDSGEPGDNSRFVRFAFVSWNLPPIDISDPKQVEERIGCYFQHCIENDRRPGIVGICNWLGINRDTFNSWERGETRTATHSDIVKKAKSICEEIWADLMMANKINPGAGCFMGKNWFNYSDTQQIVVTPNNTYQAASDEELKGKYLTDIPEEE